MKMKHIALLCCIALVAFVGCKKANNNRTTTESQTQEVLQPDSLISASVLYYNSASMSKAMYGWDDIKLDVPSFKDGKNWGVLDATIDDAKVIAEIDQLLKTLEPDTASYLPDYRIAATLHYSNGKTLRLGISHPPQLDRILVNDVPQKTNNRLLYVIKNNIGLYSWLIGHDELSQQSELFDNSFLKEPFIQNVYYKEVADNL